MKRFYLFIMFAAIFSAMFGVSGHITTDTTWSTDQIVTGVLYIDEGVTLIIMSGIHVTFPKIDQNADGIGDVFIEVSGRLQVQGTVYNKVIFTSNQSNPAPSDWLGIKYITPQSGMLSTISNAEILYAHEPLFINGRNITLNNVRIAYSGDYGMRINNTFLNTNITNCTIEENAGYGLLIETGPVNITGLILFHNGSYGLKLMEPSIVTVSDLVSSTNSVDGIWVVNDLDAIFTNSRSVSNGSTGVNLDNCTVQFNNSSISNNDIGVLFRGSSGLPVFTNCTISNNERGVNIENQPLIFNLCDIESNSYYGFFIFNASVEITNCNLTNNGNHNNTTPTVLPISTLSIPQNTWFSTSGITSLPMVIWDQISLARTYAWIDNVKYNKDGGWKNWIFSYVYYRNYTRLLINQSIYLDHQYVFNPGNIPGYTQHDMPQLTVEGAIGRLVQNRNDVNLDLYNNENCPDAIVWGVEIRYADISEVDVIIMNSNVNMICNMQYNWWGDIEYVTSNVQQLNAGTANLNGALAARISNAGCVLPNLVPSISIVTPVGMTLNPDTVNISWTDRDLDDNAMISLYYTDDLVQTGTLIADNISEDSNINSYTWNCADVPFGTYYIKAIISDGVNPPVTATSSGRIMVGALQVKMPANATGVAGTQVLIPVQTVNSIDYFNIISFQLTLTYSNSILQATGIDTDGTLTGETWTVYANTSIPGQISINGFSTEPLNSSGNLVNIVFNVQPGAANYATSPLNFADCVLNNGTPEATLVNGLFRVVNQYSISGNVHYYMGTNAPIANVAMTLTGDQTYQVFSQANGNFILPPVSAGNYVLTPSCNTAIPSLIVTPYDAALTAQFALDLYAFSNNQQKAADVNGDNQATVFDAALIAQYSVGLINTFTPGIWGFSPPNQTYNLVSNFTNVEFLGYAIGDPSGNWTNSRSDAASVSSLSVSGGKGSTVSIPIEWEQEFISGYLQLHYDTQQLRYLGVDYASELAAMQNLANVENGILRIASFGIAPASCSEPVYTIRFEVLGNDMNSSVYLEAVQFDEVPVTLNPTGVIPENIPDLQLSLSQNYPNPFNPITNISYTIPRGSKVTLRVYNLKGQMVKELVNKNQNPGTYTLPVDASNLGSGLYLYRLETDTGCLTRKMVLAK